MLMNKTRFPLGSLIAAQPHRSRSPDNHICRACAVVSLGDEGSDGFHPHWRRVGERRKVGGASELSHGQLQS